MLALTVRRAAAFLAVLFVSQLLAACGGDSYSAPPAAPAIASFTATPATLPAGGGQVTLAWSSSNAGTLAIDNGVGDVSGSTSKTITVSAGAIYTLTATNDIGSATASTVVTVAAVTAPTITSFTATPATLPAGGGSVTLSWASSGATTLAIDNDIGDVSGTTSKTVNVAANTTFTLTASNAVGTVSQTTAVTLAQAADRYVDSVNGSDSNPCTLAAPCKSILKSLTGAPAGATLALADGIYSQATEGNFTVGVPDGVTLRATHPGAVKLADVDLFLRGSATIDGLVFGTGGAPNATACGAISAGSTTSSVVTLNLIGVFSNCNRWLVVGANVHATMTPGALPGGQYTNGLPANVSTWVPVFAGGQLLIQGGVLEGNGTGVAREQGGVLDVADGGMLTLDGATVRNYAGIAIHTTGTARLQNGTLIDHVGAAGDPGPLASSLNLCTTNSAIVVGDPGGGSLSMDHSTLSNAPSAGICVAANPSSTPAQTLQITNSTITGMGGAAIEDEVNLNVANPFRPAVTIDRATLTNNGRAIFWLGGAGTSFTISNTTITGSTGAANTGGSGTDTCLAAAVHFDVQNNAGSFKLRGSTVSNNAAEGLCLQSFSGALTADLGASTDPGGNTLTANGAASVRVLNALATTVDAIGNTWAAGQQGADANGRYSLPPAYAPVTKTGPAAGANFKLDSNTSTLYL